MVIVSTPDSFIVVAVMDVRCARPPSYAVPIQVDDEVSLSCRHFKLVLISSRSVTIVAVSGDRWS